MKKNRIYIAGQEGMVGQAIYKLLSKKKYFIIDCPRKKLDLTNQSAVKKWFKYNKPNYVINAAGKVGGVLDNSLYKTEYLYNNILIGFNLLKSSLDLNVDKFINLGSACIYPKITKQPIKEEYLLSSYLEKTNEGYALSKIATLKYTQYIKEFYKKDFISLMPANLYGEGDNFDLNVSHVIPALVRKFHEGKIYNKKTVEIWGTGKAKREFLHVSDLADAVYFCLKKKISENYLNIGSTDYLSIKELALIIKNITNFRGKVIFNKKYPEGVARRKLDNSLINNYGWSSKVILNIGLKKYYQYFQTLNN